MSEKRTAAVIARDENYQELVTNILEDKNYEVKDEIADYSETDGLDLVITEFGEHLYNPREDSFLTPTVIYSTQDIENVENWGFEVEGDGSEFERINENPPVYFGIKSEAHWEDFNKVVESLEPENEKKAEKA